MTAIGFGLLCIGFVVLFVAFDKNTLKTVNFGEGIGATLIVIGFMLLIAGIVTFLWKTMP